MKKQVKFFGTFLMLLVAISSNSQNLNKQVARFIEDRVKEMDQIDDERKASLVEISEYLFESLNKNQSANIVVICTHNSRRSQLGQVMLSTAAIYYGVEGINAFSGGTEATAFNKNASDALQRIGFGVNRNNGDNPKVEVSAGSDLPKWILFSKKYDDPQNPEKNFGAIMVCSDADKSCPFVKGAEFRVAAPFDDPRYYDDTPSMKSEYDKTARLIATEMLYVVKTVKEMQNEQLEEMK